MESFVVFLDKSLTASPYGCTVYVQCFCRFDVTETGHITFQNVIFALRKIHFGYFSIDYGVIVFGCNIVFEVGSRNFNGFVEANR